MSGPNRLPRRPASRATKPQGRRKEVPAKLLLIEPPLPVTKNPADGIIVDQLRQHLHGSAGFNLKVHKASPAVRSYVLSVARIRGWKVEEAVEDKETWYFK